MGTTTDRLLSRRESWTGAVIQCLNVPQSDPMYGQYYRVRYSHRDPGSGAWEIRWDPQTDRVEPMAARWETVYRFDGTTWDLPARPTHVVPWVTIAVAVPVAMLCWPVCYALFGNYELATLIFLGCFTVPLWNWFFNVEPVRATKVAAAYEAAHIAAQAHYRHQERTYLEESNARWAERAPRFALNQDPQPERILPSGLILPAEHVKDGWKR